jgi:site-specific recombinase XerD
VRTFEQWAERYRATRIDYAAETTKNMASHLKMLNSVFGQHDPATITTADVQEWIAASKLKTGSLRRYLATLRALLDFAGVEPNPARDPRVKLPRIEQVTVEPPSAEQVETILEHSPKRCRLPRSLQHLNGETSTSPVAASAFGRARRRARDAGSLSPRG